MRPSSSTKVTRKPAGMRLQLGDPLQDAPARSLLPALDHDLAVAGVERRDDPLARQLGEDLGLGGGAEDDLARHPGRASAIAVSTSRMPPPTRQAKRGSRPSISAALLPLRMAASRSITAISPAMREPLGDRAGVAGVDRLLGAADELDGLAALEVDAGDDHGRTLMPCSCR